MGNEIKTLGILALGAIGAFAVYSLIQKQQLQSTTYQTYRYGGTSIVPPATTPTPTEPYPEYEYGIPEENGGGYTIIYTTIGDCQNAAIARGFTTGGCFWPGEQPAGAVFIGPCYIPGSRHCGVVDQCDCYGYNE